MPKTFAIGDIHGCYKALIQCLERSEFNYGEDVLIQLGDVCDGWSDTFNCVEELLKIRNLIPIRGNHDQWFNEFLETGQHESKWTQGAYATLISYSHRTPEQLHQAFINNKVLLIEQEVPKTHKDFFRNQINYYIDSKNRLFIHGGYFRNEPIEETPEYIYYWDRDLWLQARSTKDTKLKTANSFSKIFIGHTHIDSWRNPKAKPMYEGNLVWNLDTGAGYAGKLTIMNVDTEEYFQSDFVNKLYDKEKGRN